ncbi:hypothetical protein FGO68_gene5450 [Halteria grandinella]|uniref:Uncharacterized protein n=1 Tax=Halteria grandinella TaxID=5974 RepID=A0A8J8NRK2_HALGN|nr:hypothetical protein FGO68_gene5450 [Halteria grandinella]
MSVRQILSQKHNGYLRKQDFEEIAHHFGLTPNQAYKWNWDITKKEHLQSIGMEAKKAAIESHFDLPIQQLAEEFNLTEKLEAKAKMIISSDSPKRTRIVTRLPRISFRQDQKASELLSDIESACQVNPIVGINQQKESFKANDAHLADQSNKNAFKFHQHSWSEVPIIIEDEIIAPPIDHFFIQSPTSNLGIFKISETESMLAHEQSLALVEKQEQFEDYNYISGEFLLHKEFFQL